MKGKKHEEEMKNEERRWKGNSRNRGRIGLKKVERRDGGKTDGKLVFTVY